MKDGSEPAPAPEIKEHGYQRILDNEIADIQQYYAQDTRAQEQHVAARLKQVFDRHVDRAMRKCETGGRGTNPVLIGKFFSHVLITEAEQS